MLIFLLLALWVRLWFDIAEVRAVARNERGMWRNLWTAWRITWHDSRHLFRIYFCISLVAWVTLVIGLVIWAHLPPTSLPLSFVLLELIVFAQLMTRLWQLASATTWYQRHAEMVVVEVEEVVYTTPHPEEIDEATPAPELPSEIPVRNYRPQARETVRVSARRKRESAVSDSLFAIRRIFILQPRLRMKSAVIG
jgi:hypothetical protein